jgi:predicted O-methyltransferase YrrM
LTEATVPRLVEQAYAVARQQGFPLTRDESPGGGPSACLPGVGRFLAMLASGSNGGVIAELGTGAGIGAAWIASAMPADCMLVTAELDSGLATDASQLLADDARVRVLPGDASAVRAASPAPPPGGPM